MLAPPTEGLQSYGAYRGNVAEPEWQCQAPPDFYGSFSALPWHCQREHLQKLAQIPYEIEKKESPTRINPSSGGGTEPPAGVSGVSQNVLSATISATTKRIIDGEGDKRGSGDGCIYSDGRPECAVQIENPGPDPIDPYSAEYGTSKKGRFLQEFQHIFEPLPNNKELKENFVKRLD